jgi:hypothetical protein
MIYDFPGPGEQIRQGDLFRNIPRIDLSLETIQAFDKDEGIVEQNWNTLVKQGGNVEAVLPITPVTAIVISQDCDAIRSPDLSLCEIYDFRQVYPTSKDADKPLSWAKIITEHARRNPRWFYLPPGDRVFETKMGVDFHATFRLPRAELERYRENRTARLNDVARRHFRERLGEFFRRYPYDEWYPLDPAEFAEYRKQKHCEDSAPFPWQK